MAEVLFIQDLFYECCGIMYLSAILKNDNVSTDLLIEKNLKKILQYIFRTSPKLVCFSVMSGMHKFPIKVSKEIKKCFPGIKIIAGGPHPTFFPDYILEGGFDAVCIGEGDLVIKPYYDYVLKRQDISKVPNIVFKDVDRIYKNPLINLVDPLDTLPFSDRDLYDKYSFFKNSSFKAVHIHRGCPFGCSHCYNIGIRKIYEGKGKYSRFRSPEFIIEEISGLNKKCSFLKTVILGPELLFCNKEWLIKLLNLYSEKIKLPFVTNITVNMVDDEIVRFLKKANCKMLSFGIETGNENIRKEILKKNISNPEIIEAARILKKYGIKFRTFNMLGIPTETVDNMLETIRLNTKIGTDYPWCSIFTPYPGTELFNFAVEHGEINKNYSSDDIPASYMEKSILKRNDIGTIDNLHKFFITVVKFPFLMPLVMRLIRFKPNIIFKLWFGFTYMISTMKCENRSLLSVFLIASKNFVFYLTELQRKDAAENIKVKTI